MKDNQDCYVYVYIDPRNNEEFYYGKGRGKRKYAHLLAQGESAKIKRISDIRKEGEQPIIRVIAADLTQDQALLIESTLLWKLGKNLTNVISGVFANKFRPHNTLHKELPGFDFNHAIYYVNVGEGVSVNVGVEEGVRVGVAVKVDVGVDDAVGVKVGVNVAVFVGVSVGVFVSVDGWNGVKDTVGVTVIVGVRVWVKVGVMVPVTISGVRLTVGV